MPGIADSVTAAGAAAAGGMLSDQNQFDRFELAKGMDCLPSVLGGLQILHPMIFESSAPPPKKQCCSFCQIYHDPLSAPIADVIYGSPPSKSRPSNRAAGRRCQRLTLRSFLPSLPAIRRLVVSGVVWYSSIGPKSSTEGRNLEGIGDNTIYLLLIKSVPYSLLIIRVQLTVTRLPK